VPDLIPVSDGAGEVVETGADVWRVRTGDRVVGAYRQGWIGGELTEEEQRTTLGGALHGVLAEYVVFRQEGLVPLPAHLSFEEGATLPCAALTAWSAVSCATSPIVGQTIVTLGTGGVSIFALQFALLAGARVIVTSSSDEKLQRVAELGASHRINYVTHPDWPTLVREATGGRGADLVVEVGGSATLLKSFAAVRQNGCIVVIGTASGGEPVSISPNLARSARLQPISVGPRQAFEAMNRAISMHGVRPVIDRVFPFERSVDAYHHLATRSHVGKVVIRVA
jgi:NADPH:quinone reductase-like Zn-dependent oxidoreductase